MIRDEILNKVKEFYKSMEKKEYIPGKSKVHYSGRVFDEKEIINLVDASLDFWLTEGRYTKEFITKLCNCLVCSDCIVTNSGSSASLLAISALTSYKLGDRRLKPGDEVITTANAFPTTVTPIIQNRLVPVFLDIELNTYNIDTDLLENAITEKTKCIFLAHTMGNPFDINKIKGFCDSHNLWLVEDNCDALGSKYNNQYTGTFGDLGTLSFFPAHHITMGEGGAVIVNNTKLYDIVESFRHWGSACSCPPGTDNKCGKRFAQQLGSLPYGYDHKYTYDHLGYNLKITDMQAAIGCAQLDKLDSFCEKRRSNYKKLYDGLKCIEHKVILPKPQLDSNPSWFSFLMTLKDGCGLDRNEVVKKLEDYDIQTRLLFTGNITRHPMMYGVDYRINKDLTNTDKVMNDSFMVGVYPGLTDSEIDYMIEKIKEVIL